MLACSGISIRASAIALAAAITAQAASLGELAVQGTDVAVLNSTPSKTIASANASTSTSTGVTIMTTMPRADEGDENGQDGLNWPPSADDANANCALPANASDGNDTCTFADPPWMPFKWDSTCRGDGGLGCVADGWHCECRFCGKEPYLPCGEKEEVTMSATSTASTTSTVLTTSATFTMTTTSATSTSSMTSTWPTSSSTSAPVTTSNGANVDSRVGGSSTSSASIAKDITSGMASTTGQDFLEPKRNGVLMSARLPPLLHVLLPCVTVLSCVIQIPGFSD